MRVLENNELQDVNGGVDPITAVFVAGVLYGFFSNL